MSKKKSFEETLKKLEEIAEELEAGELPLEEAIVKYEEGVGAYKDCSKFLSEARKRIEMLVKDEDGERTVPFERAGEAEDGEAD